MTEITQNSLASHHSVDEASRHPGDRNDGNGAPGVLDDSSPNLKYEAASGTVKISFNAHMRLQAYQEQSGYSPPADNLTDSILNQPLKNVDSDELNKTVNESETNKNSVVLNRREMNNFSEHITGMLSEVHSNIVHASEPGYKYLVNMLSNYQTTVEDPQQLQEVMRKEEFFLTRRKPFMDSADFQSYSQVLNQFSNIIAREQFT